MKSLSTKLAIPEFPSLWPHMLVSRGNAARHFPFSAPNVHYFYFARIAVWLSAHIFRLQGKEVLVPAYHHGVEIEALAAAGAIPVFYSLGPRWEINLCDVERRISPRTGALYMTHFAGFPGEAAAMRALADKHGIPLIEDCALSLFSRERDRPLGTTGDAAIFCLYKTLPVPNGGALVLGPGGTGQLSDKGEGRRTKGEEGVPPSDHRFPTPDPYHASRHSPPPLTTTGGQTLSAFLRNVELRGGAVGKAVKRVVKRLGRRAVSAAGIERVATGSDHFDPTHVNIGMSGLSRRIIEAQDVQRIVRARRRNYRILQRELNGVVEPLMPELPRGACPLFYPVLVSSKERVVRELRARGVGAVNFWRHSHPTCALGDFPDVARLRATVMEIPCHQDLDVEKARKVAAVVREVICGR